MGAASWQSQSAADSFARPGARQLALPAKLGQTRWQPIGSAGNKSPWASRARVKFTRLLSGRKAVGLGRFCSKMMTNESWRIITAPSPSGARSGQRRKFCAESRAAACATGGRVEKVNGRLTPADLAGSRNWRASERVSERKKLEQADYFAFAGAVVLRPLSPSFKLNCCS